MTNWCYNCMTIRGSRKDISQLLNTVKGEKECIDFNKIIPMPAELMKVLEYGILDKDMELVKNEISGKTLTTEEQDRLNSFIEDQGNNKISIRENAKLALYCLEHYGARNWYDWRYKYWGVKWTASDSNLCYAEGAFQATMSFETPWGYPKPIFKKLAEMFPDLDFEIFCNEPNMGFGAEFVYENGRIQSRLEGEYHQYSDDEDEEEEDDDE